MIGLFVTALVGLYTIEDLWEKFGDLKMPVILTKYLEIAFGSRITLKNMGWGGGLLHSHVQTYPVGSGQQQITCYHYKDENNDWFVLPNWQEPSYNPNEPIRYLADGDIIRLNHPPTSRNLHSHTVAAPVTNLNYEVSCYGNSTVGDVHDHWVVEVVDDIKQGSKDKVKRVHSLTTRLRFRHQVLGCYLRAANAVLPQWGFKQIEVSCDKENNIKDTHTYWNVESHRNDRRKYPQHLFYTLPNPFNRSACRRNQVLPFTILARLLASQRSYDDL
ncbi:glycosyltransferase family protein [Salix suchowensis]|nr:glycosyltransferase family protein [Salix suchowensis]